MGNYSGIRVWHSSIAMITDDEVYDAITHNSRIQPLFDNTLVNHATLTEGVQRIFPVANLSALRAEQAAEGDVRLVIGDGLYYADTDTTTADDGFFAIRSAVRADLLWRFSSAWRINNPGGFAVLSVDGKLPPAILPAFDASRTWFVDMLTAGKISDTVGSGSVRELVRGSYTITELHLGDVCNVRSKPLMITNYSAYADAYMALFWAANGGDNVLLETLTIPHGTSDPVTVFANFDGTVAAPADGNIRFSIQGAAAPDANLSVKAISDSASMGTIQLVRAVS